MRDLPKPFVCHACGYSFAKGYWHRPESKKLPAWYCDECFADMCRRRTRADSEAGRQIA